MPKAHKVACSDMLEKFAIFSEASPFKDTINIRLMLMAMPSYVSAVKVRRTAQFNLSILQDSLTEFII